MNGCLLLLTNLPPPHHNDACCSHDCWVESLLIREPSSLARYEVRHIEIDVRLLGALSTTAT